MASIDPTLEEVEKRLSAPSHRMPSLAMPPLNGQGVTTAWSEQLSAARRLMADEARAWKA